jgi:hypothetical protein
MGLDLFQVVARHLISVHPVTRNEPHDHHHRVVDGCCKPTAVNQIEKEDLQ